MALVLRKTVLPRNITLLKCLKGRPLATAPNKMNPAPILDIPSLRKRYLPPVGQKKLGKTLRQMCVRQAMRRRAGAMLHHTTAGVGQGLDQATNKYIQKRTDYWGPYGESVDNQYFTDRPTAVGQGLDQATDKYIQERNDYWGPYGESSDIPYSTVEPRSNIDDGIDQWNVNKGVENRVALYSQSSDDPYSAVRTRRNMDNGFEQVARKWGLSRGYEEEVPLSQSSNNPQYFASEDFDQTTNQWQVSPSSDNWESQSSDNPHYITAREGFAQESNPWHPSQSAANWVPSIQRTPNVTIGEGYDPSSDTWKIPQSYDKWVTHNQRSDNAQFATGMAFDQPSNTWQQYPQIPQGAPGQNSDNWRFENRNFSMSQVLRHFSACGTPAPDEMKTGKKDFMKQISVCGNPCPGCCGPCPVCCGPCPKCCAPCPGCCGSCPCFDPATMPPPCNTPPVCQQFMTGYYYYPYGVWFCGPYHVTNMCVEGGPIPCPPACCPPCCCQFCSVPAPVKLPQPQEKIVECVKPKKTDQELVKESMDILGTVKREVLKDYD